MNFYNTITSLINEFENNFIFIDQHLESLYNLLLEPEIDKNKNFNGNVLSSIGILKNFTDIKDIISSKNLEVEVTHHTDKLPEYYKVQKYIVDLNDFCLNYISIKNENLKIIYDISYLPERFFKHVEYINSNNDNNLKLSVEKFNSLLIFNVGIDDSYNSLFNFSILIDFNDNIREIRINNQSLEMIINKKNILNLINEYGILKLDNIDLNDFLEITHDIKVNFNKSEEYLFLKKSLLNINSKISINNNEKLKFKN